MLELKQQTFPSLRSLQVYITENELKSYALGLCPLVPFVQNCLIEIFHSAQ